jgi:hypothetical protein
MSDNCGEDNTKLETIEEELKYWKEK